MVSQQVRTWDVLDAGTLATLRVVPRELFVPAAWHGYSYAEFAVPLAHGKRMLTPMVVGRLLQAVAPRPGDQALEIGTGSGYVSACLARMGASVRSLELHADIAEQARQNLAAAGAMVSVEVADGTQLEDSGRYDCIVLTAALPVADERYQHALKTGGRLFVVQGSSLPGMTMAAQLVRRGEAGFETQFLFQTSIEVLEHTAVPPAFRF
jgi:protein-L-isoaspartate(D-aspartate) O-methyltransferase